MKSKITLLLFVFLAFCLASNDLYAHAIGVVTQNRGNPDSALLR